MEEQILKAVKLLEYEISLLDTSKEDLIGVTISMEELKDLTELL